MRDSWLPKKGPCAAEQEARTAGLGSLGLWQPAGGRKALGAGERLTSGSPFSALRPKEAVFMSPAQRRSAQSFVSE